MFKSIHSKILSAQLLLVFTATLSLGITSYYLITSYLTNTQREKCEYIAQTWADNVEHLITHRKEQLSLIAQSKAVALYSSSSSTASLRQYFSTLTDTFPILAYLDEDGVSEVMLVDGNVPSVGQKTSANIQQAIKNPNIPIFQLVTTTDFTMEEGPNLDPPYMEFTIANQFFGEFAGIITAQIPILSKTSGLEPFTSFQFEKSGFLTLYDLKGTTIVHANPEQVLTTVQLPQELNDITSSLKSIPFQRGTLHGIDGFTAFFPVPGSSLIVAATLPYDRFMDVPNKMRNLFFLITSLVVLICLLLSTTIARGISNPILRLARITKNLSRGEWDQKIEIHTGDETEALGQSFKKMSDDLHKMILTRDSEIELRKKVEKAIQLSHLELDQIFNTAAGGMVVISLTHKVIRVNNTFLKMMGLKRKNVIDRKCQDVFPDKICGTKQCILNEIIKNKKRVETEIEKKRSDGTLLLCSLIASPFLDINGELIGIIEDYRDITITKKAEELVKMSEKRYRLLFNSAPDGIAVLNNQGVIIDCNQSFATIYKRPRTELIGRHFTHFNTPESAKSSHIDFKKIQEIDHSEGEIQVNTPGDTVVTLWRKGTTIRDSKGKFNGILIYDRDISKQKEVEELREDIARMARHDLKTPLNGVINLPLLIKLEKNLSDKQIKRLDLIEDAGYKMLAMINSSLDLYKIEEGTYSYAPVSVNLCPLFNKIKEELWAEMQANQCSVDVFLNGTPVSNNYSFLVQGEELLCYSMLANLIKNAVESSPREKTISVYLDNTKRPKIHIHNHGLVPSSIQENFFQKYVTAGKEKGTGLGTYSARLMARTMNGDINMTSSPSTGTTIRVTMPSPTEEIGPEKAAGNHPSKAIKDLSKPETMPSQNLSKDTTAVGKMPTGKHILLAEDDPINQALTSALLQDKGFLVSTATNGREALDLLKENHFDMVLMDMQMPVLNGIEATRFIRKSEGATKSNVPIIAVTGMNDEKNSKVFFEAGINAIVPKPIQIDLLWETVTKLLAATKTG